MVEYHLRQRPIGVSIIAILGFISAGLILLGAVLSFVSAPILIDLFNSINSTMSTWANIGTITSVAATAIGVFLLIFAIIELVIAIGLWRGRNWARIVTIVFAAIGFIGALFALPAGIITLVINGIIIWYLGFDDDARRYFLT